MKPGFFSSKEFVVGLVIALLVVAGGVYALRETVGDRAAFGESECIARPPAGAPRAVDPVDSGAMVEGGRVRRVVTYEIAGGPTSVRANACSIVGDVSVLPSADGRTRVTFTVVAEDRAAEATVASAVLRADFTNADGDLGLGTHVRTGHYSPTIFSERGVSVRVEVEVPETGAHTLRLSTDVGDVTVEDIVVANGTLATDVGNVVVSRVDSRGGWVVSTDVGDATLRFASVESGRIDVSTDVGDASLRFPQRADVGYHVTASTDVGDVEVQLGEGAEVTSERDAPGEEVTARSAGYSSKQTQVRVTVSLDVGDSEVIAE